MLAFSNVLGQFGGYLRENSAVVVTGRLSLREDKDPQIVINRARPISDYANVPGEPTTMKLCAGGFQMQPRPSCQPKDSVNRISACASTPLRSANAIGRNRPASVSSDATTL